MISKVTLMKLLSLVVAVIISVPTITLAKKKLHTIGDSTMANYATDGSTDKRGWAQMLQQFFNTDNVTVNNRGKSGASSKSFYKEAAYWPTMVTGGNDEMQSGDYLLIQFAHNDEKNGGADGDTVQAYHNLMGTGTEVDYRGTTASGTFKTYIRKYITEAKAMGVTPIVVGPICRKFFENGKIRRNGRHDLGDSFTLCDGKTYSEKNSVPTTDDTYDYVAQAKAVADEFDDVPFLDLTAETANLYESYGDTYCTENIFCNDDSTHPQLLGATLIARTFAQLLINQAASETDAKKKAVLQALAADAIVSNDISFNPISGDLGEGYVGMNVTKEYSVSAFGLASETGTMTFSVTDGFKISTDKSVWVQSLEVPYTGSSLISTIYVRANISEAGAKTGTLTVTDGTNQKQLDLAVSGISLAGGEETTCVWPLHSTALTGESTSLTASEVKTSSMAVEGIVSPTNVENVTMAYFDIDGSTWPAGEIDEVSTRYIEFKATVPSEKVFNLDKISFNVMGWGGNTVSYHAYYSTKSDFSDPTLIDEKLSLTNKQQVSVSKDVVKELGEGESIYIRIYPWLNNISSAITGKFLCVSDVTLHGTIADEGANVVTIAGDINYPFNTAAPRDYSLSDAAMAVGFTNITYSLGSEITDGGTRNYTGGDANGQTFAKFNAVSTGTGSSVTDANAIRFSITPADGFTFVPTGFSFQGARAGTNGGSVSVTAKSGTTSVSVTDASYVLNTDKTQDVNINTFNGEISGIGATVDNPLIIDLNMLGFGSSKTLMLRNVVISGTLSGAPTSTTKYELGTTVSPADAGTITVDPMMDSYKEGKEVVLSAAPSFGYAFAEWQENGATISTDAQTTITMDADHNVTAVFEPVNVYTVTTKISNDLDKKIGSVTLAPNDHAGKYEEGTVITATANESKILKFNGWTDEYENNNVTTATRTVTVDRDMQLAANFEVQGFIAVFDASSTQSYAYKDTSGYPFSADVTWDDNRNAKCSIVKVSDGSLVYSQSTGTPVVRNRENVVLTGINGLYQNGYLTSDIAWQYQFSTKNFTSATFVGDMAAKNMANKSYKAMYSTDGVNYTDISGAAWDMTANVVKSLEFNLPAEAIDQETVYIRITGVGDEKLSTAYPADQTFGGLSYCAHSESGIGNVYILGDPVAEDDGQNPSVVSTLPQNGAAGVSASGTITITYSERIQSASTDAQVTLGSSSDVKAVSPVFASKSISFPYANLQYGAVYTVNVPAGFVEDRNGNAADACSFSFTVMDRKKPTARTYDAIVDGTLTQLDIKKAEFIEATGDMPRQYRSIQNAIDAAPSDGTVPYLIYVRNGYYRDPNYTFNDSYGTRYTDMTSNSGSATERIAGGINEYDSCRIVCINKPNVHIIGQSRDNVIIATDRLDGSVASDHSKVWYHIGAGAAVEVLAAGTDFHMENLTVDNENWTKKKMEGPQALCFNISGDRAVLNNIRTRSYQDTYYNGGTYNRSFWNNSEIHGAVDFIYGASDVWFEGCTLDINRKTGGFIVAPNHPEATRWGYVFNNTRITSSYFDAQTGSIWLGRPWHEKPKTVFLHTQMELQPNDSLWYATMGGLPALWAVYDFHDANGYAFSGSKAVSREDYYYTENGTKVWGKAKNKLTDEEVLQYTIDNVLSGDGSSSATGYWNPMPVVEKTSQPVVAVNGNVATWTKDDYAICYVVTVNGKAVAFPTDCRYVGEEGDVITVQSVNEYGGLSDVSAEVVLQSATAVVGVQASEANRTSQKGIFTLDGKMVSDMSASRIYIHDGIKKIK